VSPQPSQDIKDGLPVFYET